MKNRVTVIPDDQLIIVEGFALECAFAVPDAIHALQWQNGSGHIEYTDGRPNLPLETADYQGVVAPFVAVWQAEKARLEAEAGKPPTLSEARERAFAAIKDKRLEVEYAGPLVAVDGVAIRFPSEVKDETRLNSLAGLFATDPTTQIPDWKVADGVYVTMTAPLLQTVKMAGFAHIATTFSTERAKRAEVEALATSEAVAEWVATGLEEGWPGNLTV